MRKIKKAISYLQFSSMQLNPSEISENYIISLVDVEHFKLKSLILKLEFCMQNVCAGLCSMSAKVDLASFWKW